MLYTCLLKRAVGIAHHELKGIAFNVVVTRPLLCDLLCHQAIALQMHAALPILAPV